MSDCLFCKIIAGEIPSTKVFENEDVIVIYDIHPQAPVHLLVIPKIHSVDIEDMDEAHFVSFMKQVRAVIKMQGVTRFRLVHNGKGAQFVPHTHVHIMGSIDADRNL